jgi:hypothetical protein
MSQHPPVTPCSVLATGLRRLLLAPQRLRELRRQGAGVAAPKYPRSARNVATGAAVALINGLAMPTILRPEGSGSLSSSSGVRSTAGGAVTCT